MKILLAFSLLGNILLGVLYFQERNKPPLEKVIIEHKPKIIREKVTVTEKVVGPENSKKQKKERVKHEFDPIMVSDAQDYDDLVEQMESQKRDYMLNQLNIPEETLEKHSHLRDEYFRTTSAIYQKNPLGEVSLADKKELLRLEENYLNKVIELYGKAKWEKLEEYRRQYNMSVMKKMREENAPAILMAP